jgi:acyl carrier protein
MISEKLKKTIISSLDIDDFDLKDDTTADEVPGWDSLSHVNVILDIEKEFQIRFKSIEGDRRFPAPTGGPARRSSARSRPYSSCEAAEWRGRRVRGCW